MLNRDNTCTTRQTQIIKSIHCVHSWGTGMSAPVWECVCNVKLISEFWENDHNAFNEKLPIQYLKNSRERNTCSSQLVIVRWKPTSKFPSHIFNFSWRIEQHLLLVTSCHKPTNGLEQSKIWQQSEISSAAGKFSFCRINTACWRNCHVFC